MIIDDDGYTAIYLASNEGKDEVVEYLAEQDAKLDIQGFFRQAPPLVCHGLMWHLPRFKEADNAHACGRSG